MADFLGDEYRGLSLSLGARPVGLYGLGANSASVNSIRALAKCFSLDGHHPLKLFIVFSSASGIGSCCMFTVLIILRARVNLLPRYAFNLPLVLLNHHNCTGFKRYQLS